MKTIRSFLSAFVFGLISAQAMSQNSQPEEEWQQLFNGQNLDGWIPKVRTFPAGENGLETFRVEDGLLTVSYEDYEQFEARFGHIFYDTPYSHYRLRVEYRFTGDWLTDTESWAYRNSGAMIHSQDPYSMLPEQDFPISIEVQFLGGLSDGNTRPTGNLCTPGTHVVYDGQWNGGHCFNSTSPTFDGDQWVTTEVLVLGNERVVHYINGEQVLEYGGLTTGGGVVSGHNPELKPEGGLLDHGYISLQSEGHPVQFRRVELLNLKGCMDSTASNFKNYYVESDPENCIRE
jgi:hypothetical protein